MCLYFFLMAGSLWWVMLSLAWFLSAALKWGKEAISARSQIFHTVAWTVPSIQTIIMLVLKKVEGKLFNFLMIRYVSNARSWRDYFASLVLSL